MVSTNDKNINKINKPDEVEAVDKLISDKKTERDAHGREIIRQSTEGVKGEVADVMAGVEGVKEGVSEKKGESGEQGDIRGGGGGQAKGDDDDQAARAFAARRSLPTEEIMIKKIRTAIGAQIKLEMKKAKQLEKNLSTGSAEDYHTTIARVRKLQEALKSLLSGTFEYIKDVYFKYFGSDGRRKPLDGE